MIDLTGKIALVTGAGSGIGREIAGTLVKLGARVVLTDLDEDSAAEAASEFGEGAIAWRLDVTSEEDWRSTCDRMLALHGRLDVLVNNAGIMLAKPLADAGIDILRRQQAINVEGVYLGMHISLPLLRKALGRGSPSIINISSIYGKVGGVEYAAYSATKGAVRALSKAVAIELAEEGIRVNCVMPGPVATNLSANWDPPRDNEGKLISPEAALAAWSSLIPVGRLGMPRDIAPIVAFLASDLSSFATGAEFTFDGGYTAA